MFLWEFSSLTKRILFFILLSHLKQCVLGLSGLPGLNAVIILPFYYNAIIVWSLEMFCVVSQAFTSMLAKKGYSFVRGCIGYHFDGLISQLLWLFIHASNLLSLDSPSHSPTLIFYFGIVCVRCCVYVHVCVCEYVCVFT